MEIKTVVKNGKTHRNIDLREIPYGNSDTITLMQDTPFRVMTQYGPSYLFTVWHNNEEVTAFVPEGFKGEGFGMTLESAMSSFKKGDILQITKLEGKTKDGKTAYRYFKVIQTGRNENLPLTKFEQNAQQQEQAQPQQVQSSQQQPNLDLQKPQPQQPNLNLEKPQEKLQYNELEKSIIDGIKDRTDLTKEDRIQIMVQNAVPYNRAVEIINKEF